MSKRKTNYENQGDEIEGVEEIVYINGKQLEVTDDDEEEEKHGA